MRFKLSLLLTVSLLLVGCAGTSAPVQYGLHETVPLVVKRTVTYATAAGNTDVLQACTNLSATVTTQNTIDVDLVASRWSPVRAAYLDYLAVDARYLPADRIRMADTVVKIQTLIDHEQQRRKAFLGFGAPTTVTLPSTAGPSGTP